LGPTRADPHRSAPTLRSLGPIVATAIVVLFLFVSAIPLLHWFAADGELARLNENRADWQELGIASYRLTVEYQPGAGGPAVRTGFIVSDGGVVEDRTGAESNALPPNGPTVPARTIDEVFDLVGAAIRSGPDDLSVTYDPDYRFPRSIAVDPGIGTDGAPYRLSVTAFDPRQAEFYASPDSEAAPP